MRRFLGEAGKRISRYQGEILALLAYSLFTIVLTYPAAFRLTTHIPGICGDAPWYVWNLWWRKYALFDLHTSSSQTNLIYYPTGNVTLLWHSPLNDLLSIPLQMVFGAILTYDILFFSSFILAGIFTYCLVNYQTHNRIASFVAGTIYAFSPYHFAHALDLLELMTIQWLPLAALCVLKLYDRPTVKNAIVAGLTTAFAALSCPYYLGLWVLPFLTIFFIFHSWKEPTRLLVRPLLPLFLVVMGITSIMALPFYWSYISLDPELAEEVRALEWRASILSADLVAYLVPSAWHPVLGRFVAPVYRNFSSVDLHDMTVFIGYVCLFTSVWGAIASRKERRVQFWLLLSFVGLLLSLGPVLHISGHSVISLPYSLLMRLPWYQALSAPSRATVIVTLAVAVLAGFGIRDILRTLSVGRLGRGVFLSSLVLLILFESIFVFPWPSNSIVIPKFYKYLADDPEQYAILDLPSGERYLSNTAMYQYYQTYHRKMLVEGYVTRRPPRVLQFTSTTPFVSELIYSDRLLDGDDLSFPIPLLEVIGRYILGYNGIRYVILHKGSRLPDAEYDAVRALLESALGKPCYEDDLLSAYEAPLIPTLPQASFSERIDLLQVNLAQSSAEDISSGPDSVLTFWRATTEVGKDYTLFVHFTDRTGEVNIGQADHPLGLTFSDELRPTGEWRIVETMVDYFPIPPDVSGSLVPVDIRVGLWIPETGEYLIPSSDSLPIDQYGRLVIGRYKPRGVSCD